MNINTLPDLCLLTIFDKLPIEELLQIKLVCLKWNSLYQAALCRVKALTILVGITKNPLHLISHSELNLSHYASEVLDDEGKPLFSLEPHKARSVLFGQFEIDTAFKMYRTFPNVTSLTLAGCGLEAYQICAFATLMQLYANQLVTLNLYLDLDIPIISAITSRQFFTVINSMSSLKRLSLDFGQNKFMRSHYDLNGPQFDLRDETRQIHLPILSQLELFRFYSKDHRRVDDELVMWDSLKRYAETNPKLTVYYGFQDLYANVDKLLRLDPEFCRRRFHPIISDAGLPIPVDATAAFCSLFQSTTKIYCIVNNRMSFKQLYALLTYLPCLIHLRLGIAFPFEDPKPNEDLPQFPNIKSLEISFELNAHDNLFHVQMAHCFPNLQVVELFMYDSSWCSMCALIEPLESEKVTRKKCYSQALDPLKQLEHLRLIRFNCWPFYTDDMTKEDLNNVPLKTRYEQWRC